MAFNSIKITGNGAAQTAITNTNIVESVVHSLLAYNTSESTASFSIAVGGSIVVTQSITAGGSYTLPIKLNVSVGASMTVTAATGVDVTVNYYSQAIDAVAGVNAVQALVTEAEAYVASIPDGTINDGITTAVDTWSSDKIANELTAKANKTHTHTASDITGLTSSGEFTATASGALTAGKGVVVNSDGTVSTVAIIADTASTTTQSSRLLVNQDTFCKARYIPSLGVIVTAGVSIDGTAIQILHGKITNDVVAWGVKYTASLGEASYVDLAAVSDDGTVCFVLRNPSNYLFFRKCSPAGVFDAEVNIGAWESKTITPDPSSVGSFFISVWSSGHGAVTVFKDGVQYGAIYQTTSSTQLSSFTVGNSAFLAYTDSAGPGRIFNINSKSIVNTALFISSGYKSNAVVSDSVGRFILPLHSNTLGFGSWNGASLSVSTISIPSANEISLAYDAEKDIFILLYQVSNTTLYYRTIQHNGISLTQSADTVLRSATSVASQIVDIPNKFLYVGCNDGSTTTYNIKLEVKPTNTKKAIGISPAAVSSGATATIKCIGGIYETTGLTAGVNYYLASDGSLTTNVNTNGVFGVALSSTKLLITKGEIVV